MNPILARLVAILTTIFVLLGDSFKDALRKAERQVYSWRIISNIRAEGMGAGVVGTIVSIMVSLLIAIIIIVNLVNSQTPDTTWTTEANTTWASLQTNIWVALGLLVIVPIIIGAVIILSYVRRGM